MLVTRDAELFGIDTYWEPLVAVLEHKLAVVAAGVREEGHEGLLGHDTAWVGSGVVGEQLVCEHVCAKGECNTCVWRGEVERVVGNGVLLAVELMLSHDTGGDESTSPLVGQIKKFLQEHWVRCAVGVHGWCQPVSACDGGISFGLQMPVSTDTGLVTEQVANGT